MKIALLSFVECLNYGASLQVYALEKVIEDRYADVECEYIRYHKNQLAASAKWMARKIVAKISKKEDKPSWTVREYVKIIRQSFCEGAGKNGKNTIRLFREFWKLSNYSDPVSRRELKKLDDYDLYMIGSDQVWNCGRLDLDTTFLLDFVKDDTKKGSYAPSVGLKKIPVKYYKKYQKYWSRFHWLSCREKSGADLVSACTGRKVANVLDPVFLLTREQWEEREKKPDRISNDTKFVVLYTLMDEREYIPYIGPFLRKEQLQLVSLSGDISKTAAVGPAEWLWYLHHAEYVVTDSFHGTAFSVIFEKQFSSIIPEEDFFESSSDRIVGLLTLLGLQDRVARDRKQLFTLPQIDFAEVRRCLDEKKKESFDYLDGMVLYGSCSSTKREEIL